MLKRLGLEGEPDADRKRKIELGIERLLGMQRFNGSFGLWGADGEEEYWLSAYVTDFPLRARDQGYAVPAEALKKPASACCVTCRAQPGSRRITATTSITPAFAVQAYAALVLARSQQAPLGALRGIFERRSDARSGLPLVQLSIAEDGRSAAGRSGVAGRSGGHP